MTRPALLLFTAGAERMIDRALADRFEIIRLWEAGDPDAVIHTRGGEVVATLTMRLDASLIARLPNLRLIAVMGAGYEGIDVAAARARGVTVANAGSVHSGDVADHAVALVLASIHRLLEMQAWVREGRWAANGMPQRRNAMSAQRFGIVGLGNIGNAVAERLAPFGGEIAWWAPRDKASRWPRRESLLDLSSWCTTLIVATRGDAMGLVDAETIAAVGSDGLIVNISRGAVIDEDALIAVLKSGRLGYAALDVFVDEPTGPDRWKDVPNIMLTPHVAGVSHRAIASLRNAATRNLQSVLDGSPLVNEITS